MSGEMPTRCPFCKVYNAVQTNGCLACGKPTSTPTLLSDDDFSYLYPGNPDLDPVARKKAIREVRGGVTRR